MAENWNLASIEPLNDTNYFIWSEKVEGILRAKKIWKKVIGVKPPEKPEEEDPEYNVKFRRWNEWDDDNYAARTVMINTMSKAQLLRYSYEKNADKLWSLIKNNMAAQTEQLRSRSLSELSNLRMNRDESVDTFVNRAEALRNQCVQLGKSIEDYELRMYVMRGLRQEFDQNVRILESQKELTMNDIRFALKQEELRKCKRKDEKRENEHVRKAKEKTKYDICCYNCGMKGHTSNECRNKKKCFNCQGFNHIAADCKEQKRSMARGRGSRGTSRGRGYGRQSEKSEVSLKTTDEAVLSVRDVVSNGNALINEWNTQVKSNDYLWLLDSGATSHMANNELMFESLESDRREISLADKEGKKLTSNGKGEIIMRESWNKDRIRLKNVLCVPEINMNLMSVAKITDYGYNVKFDRSEAIVCNEEGEIKMRAIREENAYYIKSSLLNEATAVTKENLETWHKRLGHVNKKIIEDMKKEELVVGMKDKCQLKSICEPCVEGKMSQKNHPRLERRRTTKIMELWHMDLIGPIKPLSRGGKRYIFTIIDDYSRVIFTELLNEKSDAAEQLKKLITLKENQSGIRLKALRSDNGGEFVGGGLQQWLKEKGIKHELSPPRTPQCNGIVERANRSIIEITRTMMSDSKMPSDFWAEAVCAAVHIKNRIKSSVHGRTPYEMWNSRKPNIEYMRRFGCVAYLLDKEGQRRKLDPKTIRGIFVGYGNNSTYRIYIPETRRIKTACDVKFDENRNGCEILNETRNDDKMMNESLITVEFGSEMNKMQDESEEYENSEENDLESSEYEDAEMEQENTTQNDNGDNLEIIEGNEELQRQQVEVKNKGRPKGTTKAEMDARRNLEREERRKETEDVRRSQRIKDKQKAMLVIEEEIPKNIKEAEKSKEWKHWKQAMEQELASIMEHDVWDVVVRPKDQRIIKCKWVFDIKRDSNTDSKRYKARLVALGCGQRPGIDYTETFAPVVRTETIRLLFSIGAQGNKKVKTYDVRTAFLHGTLEEEIYMELPDGWKNNKEYVCKLKRSIYGLKQAGKCWNEFMTDVLIKSGLKQAKEDPCLFYIRKGNEFMYCGVHVDDMITVSSNDEFEKSYIDKIKQSVDLKDIGEAKTVLGMQIDQEEGKVYVHQKKYIKKLLVMYGMEDCNIVKTPIDVNIKMEECEDSGETDVKAYQELLGRLLYLSVNTRPDLAFALSCLSQFNNTPRTMHMNALRRILRYLKGTMDYRLEFGKEVSRPMIKCETDASWDRTKDAKSYTGLLLYRDADLIHWRSKKQHKVALSTTESELEAMLEGVKEITWTNKLLEEIDSRKDRLLILKCDSMNAVKLGNGGNFKTKSKLLNRKCCYIRETANKENIKIVHVPNEEMTADCLTKPLSGPGLMRNINMFMDTERH